MLYYRSGKVETLIPDARFVQMGASILIIPAKGIKAKRVSRVISLGVRSHGLCGAFQNVKFSVFVMSATHQKSSLGGPKQVRLTVMLKRSNRSRAGAYSGCR